MIFKLLYGSYLLAYGIVRIDAIVYGIQTDTLEFQISPRT